MEEMRLRFDEIIDYERKIELPCEGCPCSKECDNLPNQEYSCKDMYFAYITLGKNFDLKKEKILKKSWQTARNVL